MTVSYKAFLSMLRWVAVALAVWELVQAERWVVVLRVVRLCRAWPACALVLLALVGLSGGARAHPPGVVTMRVGVALDDCQAFPRVRSVRSSRCDHHSNVSALVQSVP